MPLHFALEHGRVDVAKVLIQNGADVNAVTERKKMPLQIALRKGNVDVVKVLLENGAYVGDKRRALLWAAEGGLVDFAKVLIQNGADVNAVDEDKSTALHWAIREGQNFNTIGK